jgi:hypothetical protein
MSEREGKFHLHVAVDGVLEVSSTKSLPAWLTQVRIIYYLKNPEGHPLPLEKKVLDSTKGDFIAEIEMWEEEPKSSNTLKSEGSA